eukprot:12900631-Prorocentrum_lima.AAC.1
MSASPTCPRSPLNNAAGGRSAKRCSRPCCGRPRNNMVSKRHPQPPSPGQCNDASRRARR